MLPISIRRHGRWQDPAELVQQGFDRMFRYLRGEGIPPEGELTGAYPVDISEDEETITVKAEVPGFKREDIDIALDGDMLRITAQRKSEEDKGTKHLSERRFTRIERAFTLPAAVDKAGAEAKLEEGVLCLRLPKTSESKAYRIEVK